MQTILVTGGTGLVGQGIRLALERTKDDGKQANENWIFLSSKDCNLLYYAVVVFHAVVTVRLLALVLRSISLIT